MSGGLLISVLAGRTSALDLTSREWERVLGDARRARLVARLAHQAIDQGWFDRIPTRPQRHLEAARRHCAWQQNVVRWEVGCIQRALARIDAPLVLLKGSAYVMGGLPPAKGRVFSDIDIMVPRERLETVEAALISHGWYSNMTDAYDRQYYRQWMHELPPLQHVRRASVVDVHHTITPPTSQTPIDASKLFARARPIDAANRLFVLAPADMLLHSILHLMQEGEFKHGLRDLVDLDDLFRDFGRDPGFWPALLEAAAEHHAGRPLYYAVQQTRSLLGTPMPEAFRSAVDEFRPDIVTRRLMGSLLNAALVGAPTHKQGAGIRLSRWLLYVRGHYMRMPLRLLIPHLIRKSSWRLAWPGRDRSEESVPVGGQRTGIN